MSANSETQLSPELARRLEEFQAVTEDVESLLEGLDEKQLLWQPAPERWSIAHCIDHLSLTGEQYLPRLEAAVTAAREKGRHGEKPTKHGWLGNFFLKALQPGSRKVGAPKTFRPEPVPDPTAVLPRFLAVQDGFTAVVRSASGLDMTRPRVASPALGLLRLRFGTWLEAMSTHEARHVSQARKVTEEAGFPR